MPTPTMAQAMQDCIEGKWTTSKKPYKNEAASGYTVYIQTRENGKNPTFITPLLPVAFELSAGQDKEILPDSQLNMELSVREHNVDCIEFGDVVDRFVHSVVAERIKELYPGMPPAHLQMLGRRMLVPKKEFKFAPQPPYAWRFKLPADTTVLVVIDKDENGKELVRAGTRADIKPGCSVRVNGRLPKFYTSPVGFGVNFEADVVLVYPGAGGRQKATAADNYGFGEDCQITVVQTEEGDEQQEGAEDGGGGGAEGESADQEGAQDDSATYESGGKSAGAASASGASDDDQSSAKRTRTDDYE
jgi:hypothetical protein